MTIVEHDFVLSYSVTDEIELYVNVFGLWMKKVVAHELDCTLIAQQWSGTNDR